MNKIVSLINFVNDTDPPLNDTNLNQMDRELDELDDRVIAMETDVITQAENAEAWANGTRGGEAIGPSDPVYHKDAKYQAEQAASSASDAATSETNAGTSATAASNSATAAANKALVSEGYAKGTQNGVPVGPSGPGSEYYENNAEYFKNQASAIVGPKVTSFNGRENIVLPTKGDYDADMIEFDPSTTSLPNTLETLQDFLEYAYPPGATVTLTLNGAKNDVITIKDSNDQTVATCTFTTGQTSGSVQFAVPVGGGTYKFISSVAKDTTTGTSDYEKTVALTDAVSQTVNVLPKNALYWYGNEVVPMSAYAWGWGSNLRKAPSVTKGTNSLTLSFTRDGSGETGGYLTDNPINLQSFNSLKIYGHGTTSLEPYTDNCPKTLTTDSQTVSTTRNTGTISQNTDAISSNDISSVMTSDYVGIAMLGLSGSATVTAVYKALWLDDGHEDDLTIYGAKEDTITITDSNNQTVATCVFGSGKTYGYVSKALLPSGTYKFTSSVAKGTTPETVNDDYSKTVTLDGSEAEISIMPDKPITWYGNNFYGTFVKGYSETAAYNSITQKTNSVAIKNSGSVGSREYARTTYQIAVTSGEKLCVVAEPLRSVPYSGYSYLGNGMAAVSTNSNNDPYTGTGYNTRLSFVDDSTTKHRILLKTDINSSENDYFIFGDNYPDSGYDLYAVWIE